MLTLLSNAFNDPSNPWYYVVGVLFLLLIFGAVAFFMIWNKRKRKDENKTPTDENSDGSDKDKVQNDNVNESSVTPSEQDGNADNE